MISVKCIVCGKLRERYPSHANKKLCSMACKSIWMSIKPSPLTGREFPERRGVNNPSWKGESASYSASHHWMKKYFGSPMECEECRVIVIETRKIQWANISGKYLRDRKDWKRLCTRCHRKLDNYAEKIRESWRRGRKPGGRKKKSVAPLPPLGE